jgi:hypothetical protein
VEKNRTGLEVMLDGGDADRRGEMRLVPALPTRMTLCVFSELASVELPQQRLVDLAADEVEAIRSRWFGKRAALAW